MRRAVMAAGVMILVGAAGAAAQTPPPEHAREVKWVRDSEEYATIARGVYRTARQSVEAQVRALPRGRAWAVSLDVDETALDNTAYELERRAYAQPHDEAVFAAWIARREAGLVPGVADFIATVRRLGGRVAWITNRIEETRVNTQGNLERVGLWHESDRLCMMNLADTAYTKTARRREMATGTGACAWGEPVTVLAFIGDQLGDIPRQGEMDQDAGREEAFGTRYFLLPNPMYGSWERRVTRRR